MFAANTFGGVEAGGTKFVCGIGSGPEDLVTAQIPTTSPDETIAAVIRFFQERAGGRLDAVGIASFGPIDLHPSSPDYGCITSTPKAGWSNFNILAAIRAVLDVPVGFDTDVNAAVLAEARWGAARDGQGGHLPDFIYLTIGTGIGGGAMVGGEVLHGLVHPEMGHLRIPHDLINDPYPGNCPYHGDCLEGLASGPAIESRWNKSAAELPPGHTAWALEARYLALGLVNLTLALSPRRILLGGGVLGGGVMHQPRLFEGIRQEFAHLLHGYIRHRELDDHLESYIQPAGLGARAGVLGGLILAERQVRQ